MTQLLDPEGAHLAALRRLADFRGTPRPRARLRRRPAHGGHRAGRRATCLAFDPDADAVERARRSLPAELADRVTYRVASGTEIELERHSFDLVVFSWSL